MGNGTVMEYVYEFKKNLVYHTNVFTVEAKLIFETDMAN